MGQDDAYDDEAGRQGQGAGEDDQLSHVLQAVMDAAYSYLRCLKRGCPHGAECPGYRALILASYAHAQTIVDRLATRRRDSTRTEWQATRRSLEAVADELDVVVQELTWEFRIKAEIAAGRVGRC